MLNTEKLRQLREKKQLKQENIAHLLNISQSNYAKIESGKLSIRLDLLEKLALFFEVSPNELLKTENTVIQLNSNNNCTNNSNTNNAFVNDVDIKILYEQLLASKDALLVAQNEKIMWLEKELATLKGK